MQERRYKIYIVLMVLISIICIVLVSCKEDDLQRHYVTDDNTMTIASAGMSDFTVVYVEKEYESNNDLQVNIGNLLEITKTKTNATLPTEVSEALFYEEEVFQILVGDTGFPESDSVIEELDFNDYEIKRIGNKIVIAGGCVQATAKAVEAFNNIISLEDGTSYIDYENEMNVHNKGEYAVKSMTINGTDIKNFTIILNANESTIENEFAVMVQQAVAQACGKLLKISDKQPANGKAVYIGYSSERAEQLTLTEYEIAAENGNLYISAGSAAAYDVAYQALTEIFIDKESVDISDGFNRKEDLSFEFKVDANMLGDKTGDLRILSHNIFGGDRNPTINPTRRFRIQRELYEEYDADVLMLQEFSPAAQRAVSGLKAAGYSEVPVKVNGIRLYTPIFYKKDVVEVVEAGRYLYTYVCQTDSRVKNDANSKGVTWAVMKIKKTGKMIILLNTHMYWNADGYDLDGKAYDKSDLRYIAGANLARIDNVRELFEVLDEIKSTPEYADLPVVLGGDLNSRYIDETRNSVITLHGGRIALRELEKNGMMSAQLTVPVADVHTAYTGYPKYDSYYGYYYEYGNPKKNKQNTTIDHIFYMGSDLDVHVFDVIETTFARKTSDHLPIYVDVSVK